MRRALLAGCNYPGNPYELHGCVRDVQQIQGVLQQHYGYEDVLLMVVRPVYSNPCEWTRRQLEHSSTHWWCGAG